MKSSRSGFREKVSITIDTWLQVEYKESGLVTKKRRGRFVF